MSGKMPNDRDKGRCSRCALSYYGKSPNRPDDYPLGNICLKYKDYCARVAWNCETASSNGYSKNRITKSELRVMKRLTITKGKE